MDPEERKQIRIQCNPEAGLPSDDHVTGNRE